MAGLQQHLIRTMGDGKVTTWCGEVFDAHGEWEFGDEGLCWKCMGTESDHTEMMVLSELLEAGYEWIEAPASGAARLKRAIEQLGEWMDPEGFEIS